MQVGLSLARPDLVALPDQQHQWTPGEEVDRGERALGCRKAGALAEWQGVESDRKGKDLASQVDQRGYLCGLRLVAIRAVGVGQRRPGLHADARDSQADGQADPMGALLHAHAVNDQADGYEQRDECQVQTHFRLAIAVMAFGIAVDQHIRDPAGACLTYKTS